MTYRDYRDIPLDVLRDFAQTRCDMGSLRAAADEAGVSHSALHKFASGRTTPSPRVRRLLGLWYLARQNEAADIDVVRPFRAALATLVSGLPAHEHDAALSETVAALRAVYEARDVPLPRWLHLLAQSVNAEGSKSTSNQRGSE